MARPDNDHGAAVAIAVRPARIAVGAILVAGCIVSLAFNLPGHLSYDSVLQLLQGRAGIYNNWHPPIMAWMLGLGDAVVAGTALFVVVDTLLLYGTLFSLLLLPARPSRWTAVLAAALVASPHLLIYPGIVWKDVLFAATALAGFTTLAHAAVRWEQERTRGVLLVVAFLLLAVGALARQNGAVVVVFGAIAVGVIAAGAEGPPRLLRGLGYGLASLLGAALVVEVATRALNTRSDGAPVLVHQLKNLRIYDLAAALSARPSLELEYVGAANPTLERLLRSEGVAAYTPKTILPIEALDDLRKAEEDTPASVLSAEWRRLMVRHPDLYLNARAMAFAWLFFTPDIDACLPFHVGIDGPEEWLSHLEIAIRMSPRDELLEGYGRSLTRTPVFSHAAYAALAVAVLIVLALRRLPADIAIAAMLASALAFTATFFVISIACDYRYLYYLDIAAMAGALYLAMGAVRRPARAR